jgi:hypothetical protein
MSEPVMKLVGIVVNIGEYQQIFDIRDLSVQEGLWIVYQLNQRIYQLQKLRSPNSKIIYPGGKKRDMQLLPALIEERKLGEIFENGDLRRIELKTENWQWSQTGNVCVEHESYGRPSGIAATDATCWTQQLCRDGKTLLWLMFPHASLLALVEQAKRNRGKREGGDDHQSKMTVVPLSEILRWLRGSSSWSLTSPWQYGRCAHCGK